MRRSFVVILGASLVTLLFAANALAMPGVPTRQAVNATQRQAINRVESHAAALGAPASPAQLKSEAAQLLPDLKAAVATGQAAAGELLYESAGTGAGPMVLRSALGELGQASVITPTSGAPSDTASIAKAKLRRSRFRFATDASTANMTGCYGSVYGYANGGNAWSEGGYSILGGLVARVDTFEDGWCGARGTSNCYLCWYFTAYDGPQWGHWTWTAYCLSTTHQGWGWDVWPSWIHFIYAADVGNSTPWGCITFASIKAPLRIVANGQWDAYDDWPF